MTLAIDTIGLTKRFGRLTAVNDVALAVPEGAVYGFLGPNGAGKSTTIRMLLGLTRPSAGAARVFGHDVRRARALALSCVGAVVETPPLYDHLSGRENLALTARLLNVARGDIDRVLELMDLTAAAKRKTGGYSLGMRQRLGLARALLGAPRVIMLDEPTNGLDPAGVRDMRALIRTLPEAAGATVLVSSHLLTEIDQVASHVGLMRTGELVFQGTLEALRAAYAPVVEFRVDDASRAAEVFEALGVPAHRRDDGAWIAELPDATPAARQAGALNRGLVEAGVQVSKVAVIERSLEDIFLALTQADPMQVDPAAEARP